MGMGIHTAFQWSNPKKRDYLEDISIAGRATLN
jgi:hypothetical protein